MFAGLPAARELVRFTRERPWSDVDAWLNRCVEKHQRKESHLPKWKSASCSKIGKFIWRVLTGKEDQSDSSNRETSDQFDHYETEEEEPDTYVDKAKRLLRRLCDLQLITGLGIVISGLSSLHTITYYHEQQVINYWYLTLDSFWAARMDFMNYDSDEYRPSLVLRYFLMFCSCVLGVAFQISVQLRESGSHPPWDNIHGPCYRWGDGSPQWPWAAGITLYAIFLFILLLPGGWMALRLFTEGMDTFQIWAIKRYLASKGELRTPDCGPKAVQAINKSGPNRGRRVYTWGWAVVVILVFVFIHFLAVWSYGDGFYPLLWFTYVCFNTWNTADVISLRVLNAPLLGPEETEMGFGQVLPLVLMGDILFHIVGVFRGKLPCDGNKIREFD